MYKSQLISSIFNQILIIIQSLPWLYLIRIQFFNINRTDTGPILTPLHLHPVLFFHLHKRRPYSLVSPLSALLRILFIIATTGKHPSLVELSFFQSFIVATSTGQRRPLDTGIHSLRIRLGPGIEDRRGVDTDRFFKVFLNHAPHLLLDPKLDLLLDRLTTVVLNQLQGHLFLIVALINRSTNIPKGNRHGIARQIELEFLNRARKEFIAALLDLTLLWILCFGNGSLQGL